jgi:DNA-binding transcriptional ArsR family regulator
MADEKPSRITELDVLKAVSNPLRMRIYRALSTARTATASQLAEEVDEAVSLVSYHLRRLAATGIIEEAERQSADGRERWWQLASQGLSFRGDDFRDAPERAAAHMAFARLVESQRHEAHGRFLDEQAAWGQEWRDASFDAEYLARLTAAELEEFGTELNALAKRWTDRAHAAQDAGDTEGRENVAIHLYGFPFRH